MTVLEPESTEYYSFYVRPLQNERATSSATANETKRMPVPNPPTGERREEIRTLISGKRAQLRDLEPALIETRYQLAVLDATLEQLEREGQDSYLYPDWQETKEQRDALLSQVEAEQLAIDQLKAEIQDLKIELYDESFLNPFDEFSLIPTDVPLLLLPVRLETRFIQNGLSVDLLIRVFPEQIHADGFIENLTEEELNIGKTLWREAYFYTQDSNPLTDPALHISWEEAKAKTSLERLGWIVQALNPRTVTQPSGVTPDTLLFPDVKLRLPGWLQAVQCRLLPDRWRFVGYRSGVAGSVFERNGALIPDTLALGPSPDAGGSGGEDTLVSDPDMLWMTDFQRALDVGMAIRVEGVELGLAAGLDRLVVFGIRASALAEDGTDVIERMVLAHRSTDGLSIVAPYTPTKNTESAEAGYDSKDLDTFITALFEVQDDASFRFMDGYFLARWLGTSTNTFQQTEGATNFDERDARAMQSALVEATLGYYLVQMMARKLTLEQYSYLRDHFRYYVRPRGFMPSLRVGTRPYGILPVTLLSDWALPTPLSPEDEVLEGLASVIDALREEFRSALSSIPRLDDQTSIQDEASGESTLLKILCMQPSHVTLQARSVYGDGAADSLWSCLGHSSQDWWTAQQSVTGLTGELASYVERSRLSYCTLSTSTFDITQPLVSGTLAGTEETLGSTASRTQNYIKYFYLYDYTHNTDGLENSYATDVGSQPLLFKLLRHSYLMEYTNAAKRYLISRCDWKQRHFEEQEILEPTTSTVWDVLERDLQGNTTSSSNNLRKFLYNNHSTRIHPELKELDEYYQGLDVLLNLPVVRLERLLRETLDACSYRLDAWISSFANRRLRNIRDDQGQDTIVGGFGWLENLRRSPMRDESGNVAFPGAGDAEDAAYLRRGNAGYIHAPSLNQANTAAVLMSSYLSNRDPETPEDDDAFALDLSSARARIALELLDGMRSGQSLEALLGYRFERALHDASIDGPNLVQYIQTLREYAPLDPQGEGEAYQEGTLPPANVVDGLELIDKYEGGELENDCKSIAKWPMTADELWGAIEPQVQALQQALDALSDATTAESVHQALQGNFSRAGATLTAVSSGETPAPEATFLQTPRTGLLHTHRLMFLFTDAIEVDETWVRTTSWLPDFPVEQEEEGGSGERRMTSGEGEDSSESYSSGGRMMRLLSSFDESGDSGESSSSWTALRRGLSSPPGAASHRAFAEPRLNAFLGGLFGRADHILCRGVFFNSPPIAEVTITLEQMELSPLDFFYLTGDGDDLPLDLKRLIELTFWRERDPDVVPEDYQLEYSIERDPSWSAEYMSIHEAMDMMRVLRKLLLRARPIEATDLCLPDQRVEGTPDDTELEYRASVTYGDMQQLREALADLYASSDPEFVSEDGIIPTAEEMRDLLVEACLMAIPGAAPLSPVGETDEVIVALRTQITEVLRLIDIRLAKIPVDAEGTPIITDPVAAIKTLLGSEFMVLPCFMPGNSDELARALDTNGGMEAVEAKQLIPEWLMRMGKVQPEVGTFFEALSVAEMMQSDVFSSCQVLQLPALGGTDHWIGKELDMTTQPQQSRLAIVAYVPGGDSAITPGTTPVSGLLVDTWSELVPNAKETTGVAFQFMRPGNRAPQALLMAVAPPSAAGEGVWANSTLNAILLDTLELAKLRAVDPENLESLGHYLPALFLAQNLDSKTVATDFTA